MMSLKNQFSRPSDKERLKTYVRMTVLAHLKETFEQRKESNHQYSVRAYARDLEIDPTFLLRLLTEKQPLTYKTSFRLAAQLNISIDDMVTNFNDRRSLSDKIFSPISRWHFFAILELHKLSCFVKDIPWISKKLGITTEETEEALFILNEQGHLDTRDDRWEVKLTEGRWDGKKEPSDRKKNFQKQVIRKAHAAIDLIPPEEREAYSFMIASNSDVLPLIRKKIRNLAEEISIICESSTQKDNVYQLHCSFFSLTHDIEKEKR